MVEVSNTHHSLLWTHGWMTSPLLITNLGSKNMWGEVRFLKCDGVYGSPIHLDPRMLPAGGQQAHVLAIKMSTCLRQCCPQVTPRPLTTEITFDLYFFDARPTRYKDPVQIIPMSCSVRTPLGFPKQYNLSFEIKHVG
jgi:hypothetical protein